MSADKIRKTCGEIPHPVLGVWLGSQHVFTNTPRGIQLSGGVIREMTVEEKLETLRTLVRSLLARVSALEQQNGSGQRARASKRSYGRAPTGKQERVVPGAIR